jgi:chaperonin cofactor prefoldin
VLDILEKENEIKTLKERLNLYESQAMKIKDQVDELKHTMNNNLKMIDYGRS